MVHPNAMDSCTVCDRSNARFCNRCKSTRYCSRACQQVDWPTHKLLCAAFSSFDTSIRPTKEHFRAVLFPVDEKTPKTIWLHCEWREEDGKYQHAESESFLGPSAFPRHVPIQYNSILKRRLLDTVYVCHRDTFLIDGSKANNSIVSITATKPGLYHDWRGPIIAYSKVGLDTDPTECRDLDMTDFRHVADYFLSYGYEPLPANRTLRPLKCPPQTRLLEHDTSDIANRVGIPIYTRRCPPDPKWANDPDNFDNPDATFLHLCCDPKAEFNLSNLQTGTIGWGWASQQWQQDVGSTVVVRQDKKPLSPWHVEALCKYSRCEVRPLLAHSMGEYAPEEPMSMNAVLAMICQPTFVIYWYKLLDEKSAAGDFTDVPFPYDV